MEFLDTTLDEPYLPCSVLRSIPSSTSRLKWRLDFAGATREAPEFPIVTWESCHNSRKTTRFARHRKVKPFPTTEAQEKYHVLSWGSTQYRTPVMQPKKFPNIPVSLQRNTEIPGTTSSEPLLPSWSRHEGRFPCFTWIITKPSSPPSAESCFPENWPLMPKGLGTAVKDSLHREAVQWVWEIMRLIKS